MPFAPKSSRARHGFAHLAVQKALRGSMMVQELAFVIHLRKPIIMH